jgi:hypothetical protein
VVEGHEVHVRAVQDELHAHEHGDRVAARGHGEEAEAEEQAADDEEVLESDVEHEFSVAARGAPRAMDR